MTFQTADWTFLAVYFAITLALGGWAARSAGRSASEYFLSGRRMPWWLLGASMVATTFSTDTPNLVTDIVRNRGVSGNWAWWAFLLTGMLTVFVYARLWRRSGILTDLEFYEIRYSGRPAAFLRGFRAVYLGLFFNVVIMAAVTLAAIKIGGVLFGLSPVQSVTAAMTVTVAFSAAGGLRGVVLTDFLLFAIAMAGSLAAAWAALRHPAVGGLQGLLRHPEIVARLSLLPDLSDPSVWVPVLLVPLAVQWWAAWYPGSEPGGGGYIAQRMLAARDEGDAVRATLLFNAAHYALRPWPWIIVALCSLLVFPDLASLAAAHPQIDPRVVRDDLAYPAMLTFLPAGLLGLVVTSLIAAYMSTLSTHLNWGASYLVHDFYRRFVRPGAGERELVTVGRLSTLGLMGLAALLALRLENALQAFDLLLQIGAGTGLLFLLRWFWWRINAWSEIAAMVSSLLVAAVFFFRHQLAAARLEALVASGLDRASATAAVGPQLASWQELLVGVAITTACWLTTTLVTRPVDQDTLRRFCRLTQPGGPGWSAVARRAAAEGNPLEPQSQRWPVPLALLAMCAGSVAIYSGLFATGLWLYGRRLPALALSALALAAASGLVPLLRRPEQRPDAS